MSEIEDVVEMTAELETLLKVNGAVGMGLKQLAESLDLTPAIAQDLEHITRLRNRVVHQAVRPGPVDMEQFYDRCYRVRAELDSPQRLNLPEGDVLSRKPPKVVVKKFVPPEPDKPKSTGRSRWPWRKG